MPVKNVPPKDEWDGDGIIAQPRQDQVFLKELNESGVPVVSLSGPPGTGGLPAVRANQEAVAELAINHFRERGFTRFAYCGDAREKIWPPTGELFKKLAESGGLHLRCLLAAYEREARALRIGHMAKWLRTLPKPVALLARDDLRAREVLDACRLAGVHVPEEIAVLGVNDDELICEMANPPLSSIMHNARRVGYEAAAMLDRLMTGKKVIADIVVDPLGVHTRQSTDLLAIEDPDVATAVRFIREHACEGIHVEDVLDHVPLSRRALEKRFRAAVGRPPHMEIRRAQLERVKELLVGSDYKLEKIAEITGFSSAQYLAGLFRRIMHMTPVPGAKRVAPAQPPRSNPQTRFHAGAKLCESRRRLGFPRANPRTCRKDPPRLRSFTKLVRKTALRQFLTTDSICSRGFTSGPRARATRTKDTGMSLVQGADGKDASTGAKHAPSAAPFPPPPRRLRPPRAQAAPRKIARPRKTARRRSACPSFAS
jgi:LacI family transcriptional regulator